jgi:deoxyribodipyrimidine photo-lyase
LKENYIVWFRQDLRLGDNLALKAAIDKGGKIIPIFIWSKQETTEISLGGASKWWLHQSLISLSSSLEALGSKLIVRQGKPLDVLQELIKETSAKAVFWNRTYEPSNIERDKEIKKTLQEQGLLVESFNASLLFEPWTILNSSKKAFQVFTPFWKFCLDKAISLPVSTPKALSIPETWPASDSLVDLGLEPKINWASGFVKEWYVGENAAIKVLNDFLQSRVFNYQENRDRPDLIGISRLSPYLHFGEISPRQIWHSVKLLNVKTQEEQKNVDGYLRQLGWREFAYHLLFHFPNTVSQPLREKYSKFPWLNEGKDLSSWQKGKTGYPIVDAGMRQLWKTGWMHNRVRMIVASFLVKDLLVDWKLGERWFWDTLVDADLANNILGWQWVAGCGADAAPYFRIFNPITQAEKFDPQGNYIRTWVPEIKSLPLPWIYKPWQAPKDILEKAGVELGKNYPFPIVDHALARDRALEALDATK